MTPENEAFNEIERMSQIRKMTVENSLNRKRQIKTPEEFHAELRNAAIEEVAVAIERMESFGKDTISSFAIYIRSMKE